MGTQQRQNWSKGFIRVHRDRFALERRHDTYKWRKKPPGTTECPRCGAVYREGAWRWEPAPMGAHAHTCPACLRIEDHYPAALLTLAGGYLPSHRDELIGLARNEEAAEKAEHPLERIMAIDDGPEGLEITTTGMHVARRIAEAIQRAHHGELEYHFQDAEQRLLLHWSRDS